MIFADVAYFFIGFSLLSSLVLAAAHLSGSEYASLPKTRVFGFLLLANLSVMQLFHYWSLSTGEVLWNNALYNSQMLTTAPVFFLFCRGVLTQEKPGTNWKYLAILPPLAGFLFPNKFLFALGFIIGCTYYIILAKQLFSIRNQRKQFHYEALSLAVLIISGTVIVILGIAMPTIAYGEFIAMYAIMTGICFLPAMYIVVRFPDVISMAEELVMTAYANSTLSNINVSEKLDELNRLMLVDKIYMNENLTLAMVAECLELGTHQTSELFNARIKTGFSRYIRQLRIEEAKRMLVSEKKASILSIGLSVGFTSQSSFYTAFKELTGMSPGQYRQ